MSRVRISDHAVLRWLERVEGVNVAAIRRRIHKAVRRGADDNAKGVRLDGVTFQLQPDSDGSGAVVVTTVYSPHFRMHLAEPRFLRIEDPHQDEPFEAPLRGAPQDEGD